MTRLLYSLLWILLLPVLFLRLWWRGRRAPAYRQRWRERLGFYGGSYGSRNVDGCIWVHAVSVGETVAAAPMVEALLARYPNVPVLMTTTTVTGSERVRALFGDRVLHVYAPWEIPWSVARLFNTFHPRLILLLETELWPNLVAAAAHRNVPVMLINGRLSARSMGGYARFPTLVKPMLDALQLLAVQTEADARHFKMLGAAAEKVQVTGSVKFDVQLEAALQDAARQWRASLAGRPVWIAASTHAGEDVLMLQAHRQIIERVPDALLIIVPRHPERFAEVARLIDHEGFALQRRSEAAQVDMQTGVYLVDSMGELMQCYGYADVAVVAGSFMDIGGHNLLEPAVWGKPVISGPYLYNFTLIAELLERAGGLQIVDSAEALAQAVTHLFADQNQRAAMGDAARQVVMAHRGALQRLLALLSSNWPVSS